MPAYSASVCRGLSQNTSAPIDLMPIFLARRTLTFMLSTSSSESSVPTALKPLAARQSIHSSTMSSGTMLNPTRLLLRQ
ncbi:Uncharacterised protein [Bordetella pertussis]|nr:Uncharacterised protein [Bordetella pertussis]CPM83817.1 Uncharacterised protein [Bordetella pertussis]